MLVLLRVGLKRILPAGLAGFIGDLRNIKSGGSVDLPAFMGVPHIQRPQRYREPITSEDPLHSGFLPRKHHPEPNGCRNAVSLSRRFAAHPFGPHQLGRLSAQHSG